MTTLPQAAPARQQLPAPPRQPDPDLYAAVAGVRRLAEAADLALLLAIVRELPPRDLAGDVVVKGGRVVVIRGPSGRLSWLQPRASHLPLSHSRGQAGRGVEAAVQTDEKRTRT